MKKGKHYIIGDVHGEYDLLMELVNELPQDAKLIFVGDLVNRGKKSREVIEFVRKHAFAVVRGNHEEYMLEHGKNFLANIEEGREVDLRNMWMYVGGVAMLQSYSLLSRDYERPFFYSKNQEGIVALQRDLAWIEQLPLYLELGEFEGYALPVVITHGSIGDFWHLRETKPKDFEFYCLSNRKEPSVNAPIFNIYGHKSVDDVVFGDNFISLDTGCGKDHNAKLSAYCLETKEVVSVGCVAS